jgi:hypothetical protein
MSFMSFVAVNMVYGCNKMSSQSIVSLLHDSSWAARAHGSVQGEFNQSGACFIIVCELRGRVHVAMSKVSSINSNK